MKKREMKLSEARVLVFLSQVPKRYRYAGIAAAKLNIDYTYLRRILTGMTFRQWVKEIRGTEKFFYEVMSPDRLEMAKSMLAEANEYTGEKIYGQITLFDTKGTEEITENKTKEVIKDDGRANLRSGQPDNQSGDEPATANSNGTEPRPGTQISSNESGRRD